MPCRVPKVRRRRARQTHQAVHQHEQQRANNGVQRGCGLREIPGSGDLLPARPVPSLTLHTRQPPIDNPPNVLLQPPAEILEAGGAPGEDDVPVEVSPLVNRTGPHHPVHQLTVTTAL